MSAHPARRAPSPSPSSSRPRPARARAGAAPGDRAARLERIQRIRHLRRRRRDLLEDAAIAFVLMVFALIVTSGLGVLALIEVPVGLGLIGSLVAERQLRKRRLARVRMAKRATRTRDWT